MAPTHRVKREETKTYQHRAEPGVTQEAANEITVSPFAVTVLDDEPRVRDLDLAERLGFSRPRAIRQIIERNIAELETYGPLATLRGKSRGQEFTEYYPNEGQSLCISAISNTPAAPLVRRALITTFMALRHGRAGSGVAIAYDEELLTLRSDVTAIKETLSRVSGMEKMNLHKVTGIEKAVALSPRLDQTVAQLVERKFAEMQMAIVPDLTAGEVIEMAGLTDMKGLRRLSRWVSDRLRLVHAERCVAVRRAKLGRSRAYVFDERVCRDWLLDGGKEAILMRAKEMRGQGILRLVVSKRKSGL